VKDKKNYVMAIDFTNEELVDILSCVHDRTKFVYKFYGDVRTEDDQPILKHRDSLVSIERKIREFLPHPMKPKNIRKEY